MLNPKRFLDILTNHGVNFYVGVPDSLLKDFCACLSDTFGSGAHIIAANEGAAVALALGHYIGSAQIPLVYMQNSGLGNSINPILSLASSEVYATPMLLMIGWRGEPGLKDEPQHIQQGRVMLDVLAAIEVPSFIISDNLKIADEQVKVAIDEANKINGPVALIIRKGIFEGYSEVVLQSNFVITREEAIIAVASAIEQDAIVVSTTGMASRELYEYRAEHSLGHHRDFLTVGGMGHASQIALGIAMTQPDKKVYCLDGDGAAIMHMGSLGIIGQSNCANLVHIVLNNGAHGSVGGQPTIGHKIDFCQIANACGYVNCHRNTSIDDINNSLHLLEDRAGPNFIEIQVSSGSREDIGRPTTTPRENRDNLMTFLC